MNILENEQNFAKTQKLILAKIYFLEIYKTLKDQTINALSKHHH